MPSAVPTSASSGNRFSQDDNRGPHTSICSYHFGVEVKSSDSTRLPPEIRTVRVDGAQWPDPQDVDTCMNPPAYCTQRWSGMWFSLHATVIGTTRIKYSVDSRCGSTPVVEPSSAGGSSAGGPRPPFMPSQTSTRCFLLACAKD